MVISTNTGETLQVGRLPTYDLMTQKFYVAGIKWDRKTNAWAEICILYTFPDYQLNPEFNAKKGGN